MDMHPSDGLGGLKTHGHSMHQQYLVLPALIGILKRYSKVCLRGRIRAVSLVCTRQLVHLVSVSGSHESPSPSGCPASAHG